MKEKLNDSILLVRKIADHIFSPERTVDPGLQEWLDGSEENRALFDRLISDKNLIRSLSKNKGYDPEKEWKRFRRRYRLRERRPVNLRIWSAAAVFALVVGTAFMFMFRPFSTTDIAHEPFTGEGVLPGRTTATLMVRESESPIFLESAIRMNVHQDDMTVESDEGTLFTIPVAESQAGVVHMLKVPRGGEYNFTLPDGTAVWLNSGSELAFTEMFPGGRREVRLKGEGYFDVVPDPANPFFVEAGDVTVRVTGTSFNIRNYADDSTTSVSLLEGKVFMLDNSGHTISELAPMQEFYIDRGTGLYGVGTVNEMEVTAWRNNQFYFDYEELSSIARKLERWYDIRIEVDPRVSGKRYSGLIHRYETMQSIISVLSRTEELQFLRTQDGTILILPR